ncbi:2OG-Fe(II) oxygenase [Aspergillus vadensis CBS 113365]|uniref:Uncharacterized protein n=1 Tax=Aspergillus vadensis (strain CBS 113365 / IMI 142717 / IBT 24658) TaxID=1448311 RepID=A0A319BLC1_ASPVC|nr:hypothetical protein BO88DRAFT_451462 [Aspergillus vadensis CBS 113365]PYH71790.1 hypothetical protein BO88DRAFT_451462 [Aspergillus vadensis CBS 113365]
MSSCSGELLEDDGHLDLKEELLFTLDTIQSSGSFLAGEASLGLALPGLDIPGVGNIRLPISADDAKAIIQCCDRSPYGKGSETLVDESVRKTWQLDPGQFSLQNPHWQQQIGILVNDAVTGLGLTAQSEEVKAELYKLLIYEEGAFFLPHQDSEKADGMFATLVVCLSSKHEGGDLIVSHRGTKIEWRSAPSSEFSFSWAAWYADVIHEVKPVISGYRVALVYNLIHRPSFGARMPIVQTDKLALLLGFWASRTDEKIHPGHPAWDRYVDHCCPPALVYALEHQYTSAELSFDRLKGVDQARFAQLQHACQRLEFGIYLANIEKTESGAAEEPYDSRHRKPYYEIDVTETNLEFLKVVDALGTVVAEHLPFHEDLLIQYGFFLNRDPNDEEYQGFTGNAGAQATHFYRATGAIIVPKAFRFSFILHRLKNSADNGEELLDECLRSVSECLDEGFTAWDLVEACKITLQKESLPSEMIDKIMQIAIDVDDVDLFCQAVESLYGTVSPSQITNIANVMAKHGLEAVREAVDHVFQVQRRSPMIYNLISERYAWLDSLVREYIEICEERGREVSPDVLDWDITTASKLISIHSRDTARDGHKLAVLLETLPRENLFARIYPFLETKIEDSAFLASFFVSAYDYSTPDDYDLKCVVDAMIEDLFPQFARAFHIEREHTFAYSRKHTLTFSVKPVTIVKVLRIGDIKDLDTTALFDTLTGFALNLRGNGMGRVFSDFLLPVVKDVCDNVITSRSSSTMNKRRFVKHVLNKYVVDYVKSPPLVPPDYKIKTRIDCCCHICSELKLGNFIEDPAKKATDVCMANFNKKHFDRHLDDAYFTKTLIGPPRSGMLRIGKTDALMAVSHFYAWNKRAVEAKGQLEQLKLYSSLRELLGDSYHSLMNHPNLELPDGHPASIPVEALDAYLVLGSVIPSKRRQEW